MLERLIAGGHSSGQHAHLAKQTFGPVGLLL